MNNTNKVITLAAIFAAGCLTALSASAQAALDELVAAAAAEGSVVLDTATTRYPASTGPDLSAAILERFGVEITVEMSNSAPAPVIAGQLIEETNAGITPAFDMTSLPLSFTKALDENGVLQDVDWAALGVPSKQISLAENSVWTNTIPRTVFYNTNLVSAEDAPTSLSDLLDPKWAGQIAGPGFGDAYGVIAVPVLGEEDGLAWVKALYDDQELAVIRAMTDVPNRVANGEFMIGMGVGANFTGLVGEGAPIANAPLESLGTQPYYSFVVTNAEHPNAAALLSYLICCTEEGRKAALDNMGWANVDAVGSEINEIGSDGRAVAPTQEWQLNDQSRIARAMDALIGR